MEALWGDMLTAASAWFIVAGVGSIVAALTVWRFRDERGGGP